MRCVGEAEREGGEITIHERDVSGGGHRRRGINAGRGGGRRGSGPTDSEQVTKRWSAGGRVGVVVRKRTGGEEDEGGGGD